MGRLKTIVVFLVLITVGALLGSLVVGLFPADDEAGEAAAPEPDPPYAVRVEVLNASGVRGQAWAATRQLRRQGFDVVSLGNAPRFDADSTLVIDRIAVIDHARRVADSLDVYRVSSDPDPDLHVDVTVILGRDWDPEASRLEGGDP